MGSTARDRSDLRAQYLRPRDVGGAKPRTSEGATE